MAVTKYPAGDIYAVADRATGAVIGLEHEGKSIPVYSTDANGNTVLVGPGGYALFPYSRKLEPVIRNLVDGEGPVNILVMGDSTGNETDEFPYLAAQAIAAKYPAHSVSYRLWNDTNQQYDTETRVQVGSSGYRYFTRNLVAPPGSFVSITDSAATSVTGDIDIRCKVNLGGQATATGTMCGKFGAAGQRSWRFELDTNLLMFGHTADGTTEITRYSSVGLSTAQKAADIWLRVTLDVDNGAAGNTATFYTSEDGNIWTQLGTADTKAGTTSIFDSTTATQFSGRGGNASTLAVSAEVKFYEFRVFASLNGTSKVIHFDAGCLPLLATAGPTWSFLDDCGNAATYAATAGSAMGGSPRCAIFNASTGGQIVSYSVNAARYSKQVGCTPDLAFINYGHNEGSDISYRADYKALTDKLLVTNPDICIACITQNHRLAVAGSVGEHRIRMQQVAAFAASQGFDVIDTYRNWQDSYTDSGDGTHPTAAGKALWSAMVNNYLHV